MRKLALLLHCAGPKVQDIFDTLEDTAEGFETAGEKLLEYFEPTRHHLFSIYQFRQLVQEEEECYDAYKLKFYIEVSIISEKFGLWSPDYSARNVNFVISSQRKSGS